MHPNGLAKTPAPAPAKESAKESASRHIGRNGLAYLVGLVLIGVGSLAFLPSESHAPVIGLIAGAATALIGMLQGITGTAEKQDKPEVAIISDLVDRLDKNPDPMSVTVEGEKVTVTKGADSITTKRGQGPSKSCGC
jgi:hypothetical protein